MADKKRKGGENDVTPERKRRKSGDSFEWLRERAAMERAVREEELKEKREERESREQQR